MPAVLKCPICEFENPGGQTQCRRCGTPMPSEIDAKAPGSGGDKGVIRQGQILANRYYVIGEIGRGGMGSIYRVKDNTLKEEVALKTLLPQFVRDKMVVERFFNEARIARKLSHPNIVRVHDIGASKGTVYISMELLGGKSLRQLLEDLMPGDRLPVEQVLSIFDSLCAALEYAHRYTVHRDIKPENVMILEDGTVKLMDFGISKLMGDTHLTSASMVMGTPHYMSPEQVKHSAGVDARADIYSLGVMLYETLTGTLPTAMHKPVSKIAHSVPPAIDPIIEACLEDDPKNRYQSAGELRAALRAVGEKLGHTRDGPSFKARKQRRPMVVKPRMVVGLLILAASVAGMAIGLWRAEASRKDILAEYEKKREALLLLIDGEEAVAQGPSNLVTWDDLQELVPLAMSRAEEKLKKVPKGDVHDYYQSIFDEGISWWEKAQGGTGGVEDSAWHALQRFLALIVWPRGMNFIPPGFAPSGAGAGFFIDDELVRMHAFDAFAAEGKKWRWPEGADDLDRSDAMGFVTYYDAQAFLATQKPFKTIPTFRQWSRAVGYARDRNRLLFEGDTVDPPSMGSAAKEEDENEEEEEEAKPPWYPPFWVANGVVEWTSSSADGEDTVPDFSVALTVAGFETGRGGIRNQLRYEQPYEVAAEDVGFRGILMLPTDYEGVLELPD